MCFNIRTCFSLYTYYPLPSRRRLARPVCYFSPFSFHTKQKKENFFKLSLPFSEFPQVPNRPLGNLDRRSYTGCCDQHKPISLVVQHPVRCIVVRKMLLSHHNLLCASKTRKTNDLTHTREQNQNTSTYIHNIITTSTLPIKKKPHLLAQPFFLQDSNFPDTSGDLLLKWQGNTRTVHQKYKEQLDFSLGATAKNISMQKTTFHDNEHDTKLLTANYQGRLVEQWGFYHLISEMH